MSSARLSGKLLPRAFFEHPPEQAARRLLGKVLARRTPRGWLAGRIVEVEAYLGPHNDPPDPAAHSHRGPTPRNSVLFGPAGHAYVYSIYGQYFCMNITCEPRGQAGCILLRALEPCAGIEEMARNRGLEPGGAKAPDGSATGPARRKPRPETGVPAHREAGKVAAAFAPRLLASGPGRLCQALAITRAEHNGLDLLSPRSPLQVRDDGYEVGEIQVTARIGIRHAVDRPLRFIVAGCPCVSGPRLLNCSGERVALR